MSPVPGPEMAFCSEVTAESTASISVARVSSSGSIVVRLYTGPPPCSYRCHSYFSTIISDYYYFRLLLFQIMIAHPTCSCCGCWVWAEAGWVESSSSGSIVITVCSIFQVIVDTAAAQERHDRGLLCITD